MRAVRFPQVLPLIYRLASEPGWQEGQIENVSRSGVLVSGARDLPVDTDLELRITLSSSDHAPIAFCRARVVRTEGRPSGVHAFAAAFRDCHLIPPEEDLPPGR